MLSEMCIAQERPDMAPSLWLTAIAQFCDRCFLMQNICLGYDADI